MMKKWKISFFICLGALFISNSFWLYTIVDNGITHSYQQVSLTEKEKAIELLGRLIVTGGQKYTKKDILHILRLANKNSFIVEEKDLITLESVKFLFKDDKLIEVKSSNY